MNAPTAAPVLTELQEVERSLCFLMDAIIAIDLGPKRDLPPQPGAMSMADLAKRYRWDAPTTPAERFCLELSDDPVRYALRAAVRKCGKRLHELGGLKAMGEVCDRQEDRPAGMRRIGIIDKWFDGIGGWAA